MSKLSHKRFRYIFSNSILTSYLHSLLKWTVARSVNSGISLWVSQADVSWLLVGPVSLVLPSPVQSWSSKCPSPAVCLGRVCVLSAGWSSHFGGLKPGTSRLVSGCKVTSISVFNFRSAGLCSNNFKFVWKCCKFLVAVCMWFISAVLAATLGEGIKMGKHPGCSTHTGVHSSFLHDFLR